MHFPGFHLASPPFLLFETQIHLSHYIIGNIFKNIYVI
nr:MAG TPA: hypothetical protein [Caudoviricetes sp.]